MQHNNGILRKTARGPTKGYKTYMRHNTLELMYKNENIYREIGQVMYLWRLYQL